jgi:hypothetical protein
MLCAPASSFTVWSGPAVNDGGALTSSTRTVTVPVSLPPRPSATT